VFDREGRFLEAFGSDGDGEGELDRPMHIEVNDSLLIVAEYLNDRIQVFTHDGRSVQLMGLSGSGRGFHPSNREDRGKRERPGSFQLSDRCGLDEGRTPGGRRRLQQPDSGFCARRDFSQIVGRSVGHPWAVQRVVQDRNGGGG